MSFINASGDILHGVAGGQVSVNNQPFSRGAAAGWINDEECFFADGDHGWVASIYNTRTEQRRLAVADPAAPQFGQSMNHGYAGGGVWAAWQGVANEHRGLYASTGFRLPECGLLGVGPDGEIGFKPSYQSSGPSLVHPQGLPDWFLSAGGCYDLQLLGEQRAIWHEANQIRTAGLPRCRQLGRAWRPHAFSLGARWWVAYYSDVAGVVLHPFDSFLGYQVVPAGVDAWMSARALHDGYVRFALSSGEAEQPGQLRAQDIDLVVDAPHDLETQLWQPRPIGRPLWLGFFEFGDPVSKKALDLGPGNCYLAVRNISGHARRPVILTPETSDILAGDILGRLCAASDPLAPSVEQVEAQVAAAEAAGDRPVAYWDGRRWPRLPRLPPGAWLGLQAYQGRTETAEALEASLNATLAALPPAQGVALIGQCYASNAGLAADLRPLPALYARVAAKWPQVQAVLAFSGYGRAQGFNDHPEVRPLWEAFAAGLKTPIFQPWLRPKAPPPLPKEPPMPSTPSLNVWITQELPQLLAAYRANPANKAAMDDDPHAPHAEWGAFQTYRRFVEGWSLAQMLHHEETQGRAPAPPSPQEPP